MEPPGITRRSRSAGPLQRGERRADGSSMRPRTTLDWRTASTFLVVDPDWRRKVWIGGLLLLVPIVGWPVALGYRKALIDRLWRGTAPLLPEWRGLVGDYWCSGMRAVGVMTVFFAPLYVAFAVRTLQHGAPSRERPSPFSFTAICSRTCPHVRRQRQTRWQAHSTRV